MSSGSAATDFSVALLREFVALGVRDVVVSPGSRSQALALAAAAFEQADLLRLHVRIDERVGGFLALGLAVESRMPVLVVTTSGTAVANLHPAVLEAHHSGVPLILLTADRPADLRGIGSNQTTVQPGIFAHAVGFVLDLEASVGSGVGAEGGAQDADLADVGGSGSDAVSTARRAFHAATGVNGAQGPVQLNLAFREPLSAALDAVVVSELAEPAAWSAVAEHSEPGGVTEPAHRADPIEPADPVEPADPIEPADPVEPADAVERALPAEVARGAASARPLRPAELVPEPHTVVIAGHAAGERAEELARALGAPLLAEVSSGARFGPNLVVAYRQLLADPAFGGRVRRAVVFGHPTLSREVPALLIRADVEVVVVRGPAPEDYDPGRRAHVVDAVNYAGAPAERSWAGSWVSASRALGEQRTGDTISAEADGAALAREQLTVFRQPVTRRMLVQAVWQVTWPLDRLVFGASRLVREADRTVPGRRIRVHSNRGLAGIDGTVATATGIARAAEASGAVGTTRVLLGDLTLLHDVGALALPPGEPRPRLQVVVGNDGGGTIFDGLEVAATTPREPFDRVLYTPQQVDLALLARAFGWDYRRVENRGGLDSALAPVSTPTLVEVPLPRG